jgi:hypothetical protein
VAPNCGISSSKMAPDVQKAMKLIDEAHALDPNKITIGGTEVPYELHYAQKCTSYLEKHSPNPSSLLATAVRAQHFRRFEVPRSSYPATKAGYFTWRTFLKTRQAQQVKEICLECGYNEAEASRVASLIAKEDLKKGDGQGDEEVQVLEDVACLVFLDDQFEAFEKEHDEDKIISILRKTWVKMGSRGQHLALEMDLNDRAKELLGKALLG